MIVAVLKFWHSMMTIHTVGQKLLTVMDEVI